MSYRVRIQDKIAKLYPQLDHAGFVILIQLKWHCMKITIPKVGNLVGPIETSLRETFFPALFGWYNVNSNLWQILVHSIKHGGLELLNPHQS